MPILTVMMKLSIYICTVMMIITTGTLTKKMKLRKCTVIFTAMKKRHTHTGTGLTCTTDTIIDSV